MKTRSMSGLVVLVAVAVMSGASWGQESEQTKKLDGQEAAFLRQAAQSDVYMVRLGQYAAQHGATDEVKHLGKTTAQDHQKDLKTIEQMAHDHGVDLKGSDKNLTPQQKATYERLTTKPGVNFDKEYTKLLVTQHTTDLATYQRERDHARDVAIREYAGKTVPTLQNHLQMAKDAEKVAWGR